MATADLTVIGLGRPDPSAGAYIAAIQRKLAEQDRVGYRMHAMGTSLEGSTEDILAVVGELHAVPFELGTAARLHGAEARRAPRPSRADPRRQGRLGRAAIGGRRGERSGAGVRRAAALGTVTGARTFLAPAALALRGRLGKVAKFAVPPLALGEIVGDKLPMAPPRVEGPGLVGRVVSGAISGRVSGGSPGLRAGAAFALAATYPSQALRAQIVKRTPIPDIACAVPEDLLAATARRPRLHRAPPRPVASRC